MKKDHFEILLEQIHDQNKTILEFVKDMPQVKEDVREIKDRLVSMESRLDINEGIDRAQSIDIQDHEQRITKLEAA